MVYYIDVECLLRTVGIQTNPSEWWYFIDSSAISLKAVLLNNNNIIPSISLDCSVSLKEIYDNLKVILEKLEYTILSKLVAMTYKYAFILHDLHAFGLQYVF